MSSQAGRESTRKLRTHVRRRREPSWERYAREHSKPLWWRVIYVAAITLVFTGASVAALVIAFDHADGAVRLLWLAGLGLVTLQLIAFLAVFSAGSAQVK